jgi:hypothetical protein
MNANANYIVNGVLIHGEGAYLEHLQSMIQVMMEDVYAGKADTANLGVKAELQESIYHLQAALMTVERALEAHDGGPNLIAYRPV